MKGRRDFEDVDRVVGRLFDKRTREQLNNSMLLTRWKEIVGSSIAEHTQPLSVEAGVLLIQVKHPVWRSELMSMKQQLIERVNEAAGRQAIRDIRFR